MSANRVNLAVVELSGFKSIREMRLELGGLNILVGANGSGKSNLISAFGLLNQLVEERLQAAIAKGGGASTFLHRGPKHTERIGLKLQFGQNGYEAVLEFAQGDTLFFSEENCFFHGPGHARPFKEVLGAGHRETKLVQAAPNKPVARFVLDALRAWKVYHFHDTSPNAAVKQKGPIDDNVRLRSDAANLAAFLYMIRETFPDSYKRILGAIRQVAPFFDDFKLEPDRFGKDSIQLEWAERDSETYFNAHALSDGTLRFICLATLLLQPTLPSLILIDEPELGLHPYAVTQLAALLKSAAARTQILVASQSVTLMNQFDPENIIVVDRQDGQSTFRRIASEEVQQWTDSYALGELWEKNVIGGRPRP